MADFTADQAAVVRITRTEPGRWDLTLVSVSGVDMGRGLYLFDASQDDAEDEAAAAADFAREHGFRFDTDAVQADGADTFWAPVVPLDA
uniref:Uncharacterized protein n=1 Tax=Neobacillus citreus TaxID=2833578 RepID=A0A942YA44_9BACI